MMVALVVVALACSLPTSSTPQAPAFDSTKAVLELQATTMSMQLTQQAIAAVSEDQPTQTLPPSPEPTNPPPTSTEIVPTTAEIVPTATQDVEARMKSAKILVYEDTPYIGLWIKNTLSGMGLKHTHVGDALGNFMENLNSGIQWDLIILDEGQRIKNWEAKTSQVIKALRSPFALVLSGTPLENRLDDNHPQVMSLHAENCFLSCEAKDRVRVARRQSLPAGNV